MFDTLAIRCSLILCFYFYVYFELCENLKAVLVNEGKKKEINYG